MNGVKEIYSIKLKQTTRGIWFCDGLTVDAQHPDELIHDADQLMKDIEDVLVQHNKLEDDKKEEVK